MMDKNTEADKIWNEIKDMQLPIFGLPNQTVENHLTRVAVIPDKVHAKMKSSAVIVALEERLGKAFSVDLADGGWVIITRSGGKPDLDSVLKQANKKV